MTRFPPPSHRHWFFSINATGVNRKVKLELAPNVRLPPGVDMRKPALRSRFMSSAHYNRIDRRAVYLEVSTCLAHAKFKPNSEWAGYRRTPALVPSHTAAVALGTWLPVSLRIMPRAKTSAPTSARQIEV